MVKQRGDRIVLLDYIFKLTKNRFHLQLSGLMIVCALPFVFTYTSLKLQGDNRFPDYIGVIFYLVMFTGMVFLVFGKQPTNNEATG